MNTHWNRRWKLLLILALLLIPILVACDVNNDEDVKVTPEEAFHEFVNLHKETKVTEIKLNTKDNELEYKIEGYDFSHEYQVRIDAKTGKVKSDEIKDLDKEDKTQKAITVEDVRKINDIVDKSIKKIKAHVKFEKWSLEYDDGDLDLEIKYKNKDKTGIEYTYDLNTGDLKKISD